MSQVSVAFTSRSSAWICTSAPSRWRPSTPQASGSTGSRSAPSARARSSLAVGLAAALELAVEACPFVEWFIERFRPCVDRIDIADATELANRRGKRRKTDRNDALDIARRLARGECPLGFIADDELMQLRKLGRHWRQLSRLLGPQQAFA